MCRRTATSHARKIVGKETIKLIDVSRISLSLFVLVAYDITSLDVLGCSQATTPDYPSIFNQSGGDTPSLIVLCPFSVCHLFDTYHSRHIKAQLPFLQYRHVQPETIKPLGQSYLFLDYSARIPFLKINCAFRPDVLFWLAILGAYRNALHLQACALISAAT